MAQGNEGKWKVFANTVRLDGPPGQAQNLNEDLEENVANELDRLLRILVDGAVASGWAVSAATGLAVDVAAGNGVVEGQQVRSSGTATVSGLPASTDGIKVYVSAVTPWQNAVTAWTAAFNWTTGSLSASQLHLATVTTDGSGVTGVTDERRLVETVVVTAQSVDDTTAPAADAKSVRLRLGMFARRLKDVIGAVGNTWLDAVPASLTTLWGKFHATTGHLHSGGAADAPKVPIANVTPTPLALSGGTMTGALVLAGDPAAALQAATKQYVDAVIGTRRQLFETFFLDETNPPEAALMGFVPVLDFAPTADQFVYAVCRIPPDMDVAQASKVVMAIAASTAAAATMAVAGNYVKGGAGADLSGAGTAFGPTTVTPDGLANRASYHDVVSFAGSTFAANDVLALRFYRDTPDAHGGKLRLIVMELEYAGKKGVA